MTPFLRGVTVAGLSFRTPLERAAAISLKVGDTVFLQPEPENQHDPFAVKLLIKPDDGPFIHIGYIPKESSAAVAFVIAHGAEVKCTCIGCNKAGYPSFLVEVE